MVVLSCMLVLVSVLVLELLGLGMYSVADMELTML